jgi:rare lipoprotein A
MICVRSRDVNVPQLTPKSRLPRLLVACSLALCASLTSALPADQVGRASVYSHRLDGHVMANGDPMDVQSDNAASRTLPLGTRARITNLRNGRSAVVTITDRGPHVKGRIIDLSPATARALGIGRRQGVARVRVTPIEAPPP